MELRHDYHVGRSAEAVTLTRAFGLNWSATFYLAPLGFPVIIQMMLWCLSPHDINTRTILRIWAIAAPAGFCLWIYAWQSLGAGTGRISPIVGATALIGWAAWHKGLAFALLDGRRRHGFLLCAISLGAMLGVSTAIGQGVSPIRLATIAAFGGPATALVVALIGIVLRAIDTLFRRCWPHISRMLTTPIKIKRPRPVTTSEVAATHN